MKSLAQAELHMNIPCVHENSLQSAKLLLDKSRICASRRNQALRGPLHLNSPSEFKIKFLLSQSAVMGHVAEIPNLCSSGL